MPLANKPDTGNQAQRSAFSQKTANAAQQANKSDLATEKAAASDNLTAKEIAALASYAERARAAIDVRLKPAGDPASVGTDHAEPMVGQVLLMHALGTADGDFAAGLISQLAHLNRDEGGVVNYHGLNFMFSVIKGLAPRDQLEAMLAAQMAAVHVNAINIAKVLTASLDSVERESMERSLNKLSRTFISQMESLKRYRASGPQMVQNVSVAEGGHAIVANLGQPPMEGASSVALVPGATNVVPLEARERMSGLSPGGNQKIERSS